MKSFLLVKQKSCPPEMMQLNGNNTKKKVFLWLSRRVVLQTPEMMELNGNKTKKKSEWSLARTLLYFV
jgi:hypothetical protein